MTLDSTINDSVGDHSNKNDAKSDPKSDSLVATHTSDGNEGKITDTDTTKGNSVHKLFTNREITAIIQGVIPPVNQTTMDGVATSGRDLNAVREVLHKDIFMGASRSAAGVLKDPQVVNWKDTGGTIPVDRSTVRIPPRNTTQVWTGTGTSVSPIIIGLQNIEGPMRPIIPQEVRNFDPIDASINKIPT